VSLPKFNGWTAMRLFFDYTTRDRAIYDYKGDEFLSLDDAFDFAETTAEP
jgi:hypothetical protein